MEFHAIRYNKRTANGRKRLSHRKRRGRKGSQRSLISRDKLNMASQTAVGNAMVKTFDAVKSLPREIQLMGLAASFVLMAEALKFSTNDTYAAITNLMRDSENPSGKHRTFDAMKFHLETELSGVPG